MNSRKHSGPQIVAKLRQADVLLGQGKSVPEVCKDLEVSEQTYYRWRQQDGGMSPDMVKQLRALQKENVRLKKVVADQSSLTLSARLKRSRSSASSAPTRYARSLPIFLSLHSAKAESSYQLSILFPNCPRRGICFQRF